MYFNYDIVKLNKSVQFILCYAVYLNYKVIAKCSYDLPKKQSHRGSAIINLKFCKAGSNRPNSVYQSNIALHSVRFDKLSE